MPRMRSSQNSSRLSSSKKRQNQEHRVQGCVAVLLDESEHRQIERERRDYEHRFRKIFEDSSEAIFLIDAKAGSIVDANPTACSMLDYQYEELCSLAPSQVHPDETASLEQFFDEVLATGRGRSEEFSCRTRRGEFIPCEVSASRLDLSGHPYVCAMVRDISERRRAEEALDRSFAELESRAAALEKAHEFDIGVIGGQWVSLFEDLASPTEQSHGNRASEPAHA